MECGVYNTLFLVFTVGVALNLLLAGVLTNGWIKCNRVEYGLFEACGPDGFCRSHKRSDDFALPLTAAQALILTCTVLTAICLIYSVLRLILMKTCCPDCYGKGALTVVAGTLLISAGALCIGGIVILAVEVEVPCKSKLPDYSVYITGAGAIIDIVTGFLLIPCSKKTYPN